MFLPTFRQILICALFLTYWTYQAHGQSSPAESYIVLVSGDTLAGKVRERTNQLIDFQPTQSAPTQTYTPEQLIVRLTEEG